MLTKRFSVAVPLLAVVAMAITSCTGKQVPGWQFMPDMYDGPSIQAYEEKAIMKDSLSALTPPAGTMPRGFMAYQSYPATPEGYEAAKAGLALPQDFPTDSLALADGAKLYGIYCSQCHGEKGDGQGILVQREKFLGVPSYADRQINYGTIFHVVTYGKGVMGSHASQVTPEERWKIAQHVLKLRATLAGEGETAPADSTTVQVKGEEETDDTNKEKKQG